MLTKTHLYNFKATSFSQVANNWGQAANAVSSASGTISNTGDQMSDWTGPAAAQAQTTMGDLVAVVVNAPQLLSEAQDTLGAFVAAMYQQQQILSAALNKAASLNCRVDEDGTVVPPPQPPGEPPQICPADPHLAAKWAQEQEAYDSDPLVKAWQTATQQAPGLQTTIQGALQAATAADNRAARDLQAGIQGGADVQKIVAGQDRIGSYAGNLYADTQKLADGNRWMDQYVHEVGTLLSKAANGDPAAASQLAQLTPLSWEQDFAARLMNQLGAAGLEKLPLDMAEKVQNGGTAPGARTILQFLGDSLASASNSPNLPAGFIQALTNDNTVQFDYFLTVPTYADHGPQSRTEHLTGPAGLWALGQILGGSNGAVRYNPKFLTTVGTAIINVDNGAPFANAMANNLNLPPGTHLSPSLYGPEAPTDSGGEPAYGLMNAAAHSPAAALMLFNSDAGANLKNLLGMQWTYDKGSALGAAVQAAAVGSPTSATNELTSNLVHDLAHQYLDPGYEPQMSGLNSHVAYILAQSQDLAAIQWNANNFTNFNPPETTYNQPRIPGSPLGYYDQLPIKGPVFNPAELAVVLGSISQTPAAYQTLCTAAHQYAQLGLTEAVNQAMKEGGIQSPAGYADIQPTFQAGATMLAYLSQAKTVVGQNAADNMAAKLQNQYAQDSAALNVIWAVAGMIPGSEFIGAAAGVGGSLAGLKAASISPSNQPTVQGAQSEASVANVSTWDLANALLQADPGLGKGQSFVDPGTGLLKPYNVLMGSHGTQLGPVTNWLQELQYSPGSANNYNELVNNPIFFGTQKGGLDSNAGGVTANP